MSLAADPSSPLEAIEQHRKLFERLAGTDLPIAEDAQRALDAIKEGEKG